MSARSAGGDIALGHAVYAALVTEALFVTTPAGRAAALLPRGWSILDLNEG